MAIETTRLYLAFAGVLNRLALASYSAASCISRTIVMLRSLTATELKLLLIKGLGARLRSPASNIADVPGLLPGASRCYRCGSVGLRACLLGSALE